MSKENRQNVRYKEIGKVISSDLCAISGVLDDISLTGCKIHFACPVVVDLDCEYNVCISISRNTQDESPLQLVCQPQWCNECSGTTFVGLKILFSPDASRLKDLITMIEQDSEDDILSEIVES